MMRDTIVNKKPFESFEIYCDRCNETVFTVDDIVEKSDAMTEARITHRIEKHAEETGHVEIGGVINPKHILTRIDASVTVTT